jgi:tRNA 2-thiouridine synthesizing protein A
MMQADVKLDTLGYCCPMPIILTSKKIKELALGQVLEVVSDDEGIKKDMPAWCETTGHQMMGLEEEQAKSGPIYKAFVKKAK